MNETEDDHDGPLRSEQDRVEKLLDTDNLTPEDRKTLQEKLALLRDQFRQRGQLKKTKIPTPPLD